jgi:hypothetical protein
VVSKTERVQEKARRVLVAAVVEAEGLSQQPVEQNRVMRRANIFDAEEFEALVKHLAQRGLLAEEVKERGAFVVTHAGMDEAAQHR